MKHKKTPPFQLSLKQLAEDLRANSPLVYLVTALTGGDGRRRSTVQRVMTGLDIGEYDIERDAWVLDRDKAFRYLVSCYALECTFETVEYLAATTQVLTEPGFREQVFSHFTLFKPEPGTLADVFMREEKPVKRPA